MNAAGYPALSGHGLIALATIALERGLLMPGGDGLTIAFDTVAGTVRARASGTRERIDRVTLAGLPSFVAQGRLAVKVAGRALGADVAFGGAYFAIVDSEAVGLSVDVAHVPELRRAGVEIATAVGAAQSWVHPGTGREQAIAGTVFTAPPRSEADLRSLTVSADGQVGRSPGGTATAALMAVLDAMGLLGRDRPFVHEGITGTRLLGRVAGRTSVGGLDAIVPEIQGSAWITGDHTFIAATYDPFSEGFTT
jgi:proline racemase